jgi:hypothetical protein
VSGTLVLTWPTVTAALAVLGLVGKSWRASLKADRTLVKISTAVLGDGTEENPSIAKRLSELTSSVHSLGQSHALNQERLSTVEAVGETERRNTRHALRTLQWQVGHLYGIRGERPPSTDPGPDDYLPLI